MILDSFQLYLTADRNFQRLLLHNGFPQILKQNGNQFLSSPILYSDNVQSTLNKASHIRKYAISPENHGEANLWKWKEEEGGFEIPSEHFKIAFDSKEVDGELFCRWMLKPAAEYHLEFPWKQSEHTHWNNWLMMVFPIDSLEQSVQTLGIEEEKIPFSNGLKMEEKPADSKREDFCFIQSEKIIFSLDLNRFSRLKKYITNSSNLQMLNSFTYDYRYFHLSGERTSLHVKVGLVKTTVKKRQIERDVQFCIKLAGYYDQVNLSRGLFGSPDGKLEILFPQTMLNYLWNHRKIFKQKLQNS